MRTNDNCIRIYLDIQSRQQSPMKEEHIKVSQFSFCISHVQLATRNAQKITINRMAIVTTDYQIDLFK